MENTGQKDQTRKPGPWGKIRQYILHPELTSEQIAMSFAIGLSIAWNPLLGLHIAMTLATCLLFRKLHQPLMFAGVFVNNLWTMVPMATASVYLGNLLMGRGLDLDLQSIPWHEIGWRSFISRAGLETMYGIVKPVLAPYLLGGFIFSALSIPVGYFGMLWLAKRLRAIHLPHLHFPHPRKETKPSSGD